MSGYLDVGSFELPAVGNLTSANAARAALARQLAAVAELNEKIRVQSAAGNDLWSFGRGAGLPERLQHWIDELIKNLQAITDKMPDVESYAVSAGLPHGVSATVTFTPRWKDAAAVRLP